MCYLYSAYLTSVKFPSFNTHMQLKDSYLSFQALFRTNWKELFMNFRINWNKEINELLDTL